MKMTNCKRCSETNLHWLQNSMGKWSLTDVNGKQHHCNDGQLKAVKCKFCNAADLHWGEETNPETKVTHPMLFESYGLPHACEEKIAFIAKQKADKKTEYESEKKRIMAHADGQCPPCNGTGNDLVNPNGWGLCKNCHGHARFDGRTKKHILAALRQKIWPNMPATTFGRRY